MSLFQKHQSILEAAIKANKERKFFAQYPEHPKAYGEEAPVAGKEAFDAMLNQPFQGLIQDGASGQVGEEESPFWQKELGILYPSYQVDDLIINAGKAYNAWRKVSVEDRTGVLIECLEHIKNRFYEIAYATMHTSGQSFIMSFQASGPHANDRALEAVAMGYEELTRFPKDVEWEKPMGKISVKLSKNFKPVPRGISLAIGCSTFPVWNTVPGIFASLVTGNTVIVKPHPKAVLPIAIVVAEMQQTLKANGYDTQVVQLAADTSANPITKQLAEHDAIKLIDYTGGTAFGDYVESIPGKVVFTEKAGVNSVILDSVEAIDPVMQNLAFSVSLYSGQMCTAPQNFFVPEGGIATAEGNLSYEAVVEKLKESIHGLVNHPKMGAGTLAAIQNKATLERVGSTKTMGATVVLESGAVANEEFENARVCTPTLLEVDASDTASYEQELFGPVALVIKTKDTTESVALAKMMAEKHGAITCAAYTTNAATKAMIEDEMNAVFTPVSFNLTGFIWVNQHAAFSDFHVTGGNPAGNASFTNPEFLTRRFVWVGNRTIAQ